MVVWVDFVQQTPLAETFHNFHFGCSIQFLAANVDFWLLSSIFGCNCNFLVAFADFLFLVAFADPIICNRLASVAGPRGSGWVQATKEIVIKRLLPLPCTATLLHCYTATLRAAV